jgi:hypothetical protein
VYLPGVVTSVLAVVGLGVGMVCAWAPAERQREPAGFPGPKYLQVVRRDITRKWGWRWGGNWCCGVGEEMDQDWGGGGALIASEPSRFAP